MFTSRAVILAKIEANYGVDAVPAANADAIIVEDLKIEASGRHIPRNFARTTMGHPTAFMNIGESYKITFTTEVKGSGDSTPDTPPPIGKLLRACGYKETIVTDLGLEKVYYTPDSDISAHKSLTIYVYQDGLLKKALGCRGTWSLDLKAGEMGKIKWDLTGFFAGPADIALPAPTLDDTVKPPIFQSAAFTVDGYAGIIDSLSMEAGAEIAKRPSANAALGIAEWWVKDRKPKAKCEPEAVLLATKDWWAKWSGAGYAAARMSLAATLGSSAGNRLVIDAPKCVLDGPPNEGGRDGLMTSPLSLLLTPDAGDDELKLTFN